MTNLTAEAPVTAPGRVGQYLACAGLITLVMALGIDPALADFIEATTVIVPLIAGTMALVRYASDRSRGLLILGAGLVIAAVLDAAHWSGHASFGQALALNQAELRVSSWFSSRLFLAIVLAWLLWKWHGTWAVLGVCGLGVAALVAPLVLPTSGAGDLPALPMVAGLVLAGFAGVTWMALRDGGWRTDPFQHALVLALLVNLGADTAAGLSVTVDGAWIAIAQGLKAVGYGLVLAGLLASMHQAQLHAHSTRDQVGELEQAREALEHQGSTLAEMAEHLSIARGQAERTDRAKAEHLATVSHEIRTPLNGVLGMAQLLRDTSLNDLQRRYVDTIISSGRAQLAILNDVLDLSKITANKLEITVEPYDPRLAAESVVELMAGSKQGSDVDLCVRTDPSVPPWIRGDEARFRQILLNLVGNALKFTERGGVTVSLHATPRAGDSETIDLHCQVEDTGAGISESDQQRLFNEFVQADKSAQRLSGTGLGLSICKKLCELMGGGVGVDSTLGEGSCFWFRIQVQTVAEADGPGKPAPALPALAGKTALVALDNQISAATLKYYLERCGAVVSMATTADAGAYDMTFVDAAAWRQHRGLVSGAVILVAMSLNEVDDGDAGQFSGMVRQPISESTMAAGLCDTSAAGSAQTNNRGAGTGGKILVVDDNAVNLELARAVLELAGYDVTASRDGFAAVEACASERFDFILMDLQMPRMDGYEATRAIRSASKWGAAVPIVALTASPMVDARPRCQAVGMMDCIAKPFERHALLRLIAGTIDNNHRPSD